MNIHPPPTLTKRAVRISDLLHFLVKLLHVIARKSQMNPGRSGAALHAIRSID